jgi:hypothetical protein
MNLSRRQSINLSRRQYMKLSTGSIAAVWALFCLKLLTWIRPHAMR